MHEFDDAIHNFPSKGSSKGPYGSHAVRQVIPRAPNSQGKQEKQESIDSVKSIRSHKDLAPIIEPVICSNCDSFNYNNNIRHANHLQRSADSGFASTEVDGNQVRIKPLTRQSSVQEGKEYVDEMAEICSSKASSKSELSYRDSYETVQKVKLIRDENPPREMIPEIKVQKMNSQYESIEVNDLCESTAEYITELQTERGASKQSVNASRNTDQLNRSHHTNAGSELIHSIRNDLSSASGVKYHAHNQDVKLRQSTISQATGAPKSHQRVSVDSLSEIPLPPLSMLMQKTPPSKVVSPSPPLPAPPADLLTDSEDVISPPPAYQKVSKDVFFMPSDSTQETSFGGGFELDSEDGKQQLTQKTPADIQSLIQPANKQKIRKPQIGAISRVPAVTSTQSPVKHGVIKTNADYASPQKSARRVAPNTSGIVSDHAASAKGMTPNSSRRDARSQQAVKYKKIQEK